MIMVPVSFGSPVWAGEGSQWDHPDRLDHVVNKRGTYHKDCGSVALSRKYIISILCCQRIFIFAFQEIDCI